MAHLYRVIVPVSDIEAAETFYAAVLGAPGVRISPGRHYFGCEGTILACFDPGADGDGYAARPNPEPIYLAVSDLEAAFRACREAGASFPEESPPGVGRLGEIARRPWGEVCFYVLDPSATACASSTGRRPSRSERRDGGSRRAGRLQRKSCRRRRFAAPRPGGRARRRLTGLLAGITLAHVLGDPRPEEVAMKALLVSLAGLAVLGCEISPVVSAPEGPSSRYSDCERAAHDYCALSLEAKQKEMDACVARYRFECVSAGAKAGRPRS